VNAVMNQSRRCRKIDFHVTVNHFSEKNLQIFDEDVKVVTFQVKRMKSKNATLVSTLKAALAIFTLVFHPKQ
jgi:hypothetical protein